MDRRSLKLIGSVTIVTITIAAFGVFFARNDEIRRQLFAISPSTLLILIALYFVFLAVVALIFYASLLLCRAMIPRREIGFVSIYSSVINFFGPLQSGPAFRALYLKKRHGLKLRDYTAASLVYYAMYAVISGILLVSGLVGYWLVVAVVLLAVVFVLLRKYRPDLLKRFAYLPLKGLAVMAVATTLQILLLSIIFLIELRAVDATISYGQALIYTGAANFALFVSITPGAIGFRESFLLLSQQLHNVPTDVIAAANLIDRSVYILTLLIAMGILLTTQASRHIKEVKEH